MNLVSDLIPEPVYELVNVGGGMIAGVTANG